MTAKIVHADTGAEISMNISRTENTHGVMRILFLNMVTMSKNEEFEGKNIFISFSGDFEW